MYLSLLIPPDKTKYMSPGHCRMCFCFVTFGVYIDLEKKSFLLIYIFGNFVL